MAVVDKTVFDSQMWRNEMHFVWLSLQKGLSEHCELQYDEFGFRMDTEGNYCVIFCFIQATADERWEN